MSDTPSDRPRVIGTFVVLYLAVGAYSPYLPVYYRSLGLSLEVIGLLAALFAAAAMLGAPMWGATADRSGSARPILALAAIGAAVAATLLAVVSGTVLVALAAVLMALAMSGIIPILDARALEVSAGSRSHYASFRVWGSASYIVAVVLTGWIVEAVGPRGLFTVLVPALAVTAIVGHGIRSQPAAAPITRLGAIGSVLRSRTLAPFLAVVLATWTSSTTINAFFSIHLVEIGAPSWMVGLSWALGAAVEVPIMLGFGWLAGRVGLGRLLLAGTVLFALRAVVVVLTSDPLLVTLSMALHGGAFALFLVGGVSYVSEHSPPGAAATAQGVLVAIAFGLAQIVGPGVGGLIASDGDLLRTFTVAGAGSVVAAFGMGWILRRSRHERTAPAREPGP